MSGYPGQGYHGGGYHNGPPQQSYPPQQQHQQHQGGYYPPQQPTYNGYQQPRPGPPPGAGPGPGYGYNQPPPQQYGGYNGPVTTASATAATALQRRLRPAAAQLQQADPPCPQSIQMPTSTATTTLRRLLRQRLSSLAMAPPSNYNFQYSNCTGRRKALLIGINYFGQRGQLRACINDVKNMSAYLVKNFGYKREGHGLSLTDDQQNPVSQPTKQNLAACHALAGQGCQAQ
ncbi:conserved hypothetical protein [Verticillium alfalfae VaMs.102]|uniref:Peptidase C14 caspase domain-containing protein n=1 Tax=Verticillium alfalfae (strain VaMs.102 / ATCC MYA-4576 / FGSC 10136) TaxID=526221 RepID=C9SXV7_VERA1|nr:conserved hypothetical protein [Verticillium alfalfae VaMs.102]EEY23622.1 conserved hypothetical protein [Verticillium alfalfae VaMs.102]